MDDAQAQLTDRLKTANNILVTVSRDPSADQLAACIGLTLLLNKQGKHAAAVFSGQPPSTIEFLNPGETLEKNTDSLRDFIIALDKNKADKLRYKVEDDVVRIFITPYKTSITEEDLDFSQGDFNVDLVVALGVKQQEDLDEAITAHGRILHDATVASINIAVDGAGVGSINWLAPQASSLSELVTQLAQKLGENLLDDQIATALLTGIIAETDRFRNEKTSPATMSAASALMAAGANQQLVASKLEEAKQPSAGAEHDGAIAIDHENDQPAEPSVELPAPEIPTGEPITDTGAVSEGPKLVTEPPTLGGALTANSRPEPLEPSTDPLSLPKAEPPQLLDRKPVSPGSPVGPAQATNLTPPPLNWTPPPADPDATLTQLEESVDSPHVAAEQAEDVEEARDEVSKALSNSTPNASPIQALNAQPLGDDLRPSAPTPAQAADSSAPPPVPPPIPFQFGNPPQQQ